MKKVISFIIATLLIAGCVTTPLENGGVKVEVDQAQLIVVTQIALNGAEQALALWESYKDKQTAESEAKYQEELAARQAKVEQIRQILEQLVAASGVSK